MPSITWPESVDEALCFGWIDGIRKSIDEKIYAIRFTPRRPNSNWSSVNIKRVAELMKCGRMHPAGLEAFRRRDEEKSKVYSYERATARLDRAYEKEFRSNREAWHFFQSQSPSYQRLAAHWVVSAKREDTRQKRLRKLIEDCAAGRSISPMLKAR
jgi:uncharacterized protein YdeI (YjbR/CyaY-like superfamily)